MYTFNSYIDQGLGFGVGGGGGGSGTVTSVDFTDSSDAPIYSVSGVPITTSGTIDIALQTQTQFTVFGSPTGGQPAFVQLTADYLNPTYNNGDALITDGSGNLSWAAVGGTGTVTSVGLALPVSVFSVSGSPVTGSGTLTGTFVTQTANLVFSGPSTGAAAAPTFRQLVADDMNTTYSNNFALKTTALGALFWGSVGTVTSVGLSMPAMFSVTNSPVTSTGTLTVALATQSANRIFAGPATGAAAAPTFRQAVAEDMNTTYSNGQVLTTDGSGVLSWTTVAGGSPGGSNTQVQYNNSGAFGGSAKFTFQATDGYVDISRANTGTNLYSFKVTNAFVSGSTGATIYAQHNDTGAGSRAIVAHGNGASLGYGLYIESFGASGTRIYVGAADASIGAYISRTGTQTNNGLLFVQQVDTTASLIGEFAGYAGGSSKSVFQVWGLDADNGAARGLVCFRGSTAGPLVSGVISMPWITGDNKPTLYVGDASATTTGLFIASSNSSTYAMQCYANGLQSFAIRGDNLTQVITGGQDSKMTSVGGMLYADNTDHANSSTTNTTLATYSLDADSLKNTADTLRITATFITAANANNKTFQLVFGTTTVYTSGALAANNDIITFEAIITRVGNNSQRINTRMVLDNNAGTTVVQNQYNTATETDTAAIIIACKGQGGATNDITQKMFMVEFLNHFA